MSFLGSSDWHERPAGAGSTFGVRFVLSTNLPGSMTRITAETANVLAKMDIPTIVMFPAVDWWDFKWFMIARVPLREKWKWLVRLAAEVAVRVPFRRRWCGYACHRVDSRVRTSRYLCTPSAADWKDDEVTVIHPAYLVPHVLRTIPHSGITIVSALHMNLEKAMQSSSPVTAAWYRHWVARDRYIAVPRYTTSQTAREAAERLGIRVQKVICDGSLDVKLFYPGPPKPPGQPRVVTLYCDPNPQKGQAVGVEAIRLVQSTAPEIRTHSIGRVIPAYANVFDQNCGFLHGEALVKAIQASDIFVYPSLYDGFPAPPLQAMACGVALVTTAVDGVTEYAAHEQNALVCEPGNAAAMAEQVLRLVRDQALRERLQQNGPDTASAFSVERSTQALVEWLGEVYDGQHSGVPAEAVHA